MIIIIIKLINKIKKKTIDFASKVKSKIQKTGRVGKKKKKKTNAPLSHTHE